MILSGKDYAAKQQELYKAELSKLKKTPVLAVILVGEDPASKVYVGHKKKQCEAVGIKSEIHTLLQDSTAEQLTEKINELNQHAEVDGILVQLPLPQHLKNFDPSDCISPQKDVDGFTAENMGLMVKGRAYAEPCTPKGIVKLLKFYDIKTQGKKAAVVGRSQIVGWPMAWMLNRENATVKVCHSKTQNLKEELQDQDIVVVAAGRPEFVDHTYFKEGAVVIDVGIHRNSENKLVGDVNTQNFEEKNISYSPVPGGVGPVTVSQLLGNLIELVKNQTAKNKEA